MCGWAHSITTRSSSMIAVLSTEENIAFGRPTNGSSGSGLPSGVPRGQPRNAVDGDTNGNYFGHSCTHTRKKGTAYPWWAVDLGSARHIGTVHIYNRVDCECDFCTCIESGVCFHSSHCVWGPHYDDRTNIGFLVSAAPLKRKY